MKKNVLRLAAGCVMLTVSVAGCNDLTEYNPGGITAQTVFTTPEGFESLVNAAYSYTRWWYGKEEGIAMSEMGSDLWMSGAGDENPSLNSYDDLQATQDAVEEEWDHLYQALNLINAGIAGIDEAGLSPELHDQRLAELRFLRAFYGWLLAETWGGGPNEMGVVFPTEPTDGIVTTATRVPLDQVYQQIFEDLDYAVEHLSPTTDDYGRVTKYAAEAFEARMYLTRGMNQEALDAAKDVILNGGYQLVPHYADLWRMDNLENPEVIWAVNYSQDRSLNDQETDFYPQGHGRGGNDAHLFFLAIYDKSPGMVRSIEYGRPFNRYMPTEYLLDLYDDAMDSRYEGSFREVWYSNDPEGGPDGMEPGDTAILMTKRVIPDAVEETKVYEIYDRNDTYNPDGTSRDNRHYPSLTKFMDPTRPSIQEQVSGRDWFVIRLAEMYLIAAEAELKLGHPDQAAYWINFVRERAALPGHEAEMRVSASDMSLDFILEERAREFAGEQMRWFDLKRTGTLLERVQAHNPEAAPYIQPFHAVRPIPQEELDAVSNKGEFQQNPGYH
jgi:hypothetical protein